MKYLIIIMSLSVLGCPSTAAVCTHLETQCAGDLVQLCDSQGRWEEVMDCSAASSMVCAEEDGEHTCSEVGQ